MMDGGCTEKRQAVEEDLDLTTSFSMPSSSSSLLSSSSYSSLASESMSMAGADGAGMRRRTTPQKIGNEAESKGVADNEGEGGASAGDEYDESEANLLEPKARYSSKVAFYPPSSRYWRIGGKWYDFNNDFMKRHPGGSEVLKLARDRFEDCTFVFEAHHLDYRRARRVISKYEVPASVVKKEGLRRRPTREEDGMAAHHDTNLDAQRTPTLLDDDAFYSVMRTRVNEHLKRAGHQDGGPTLQCKLLFWTSFVLWIRSFAWLLLSGTVPSAICTGFTAAWLGAFGHNWVHQPKYKFWAYLSLDMIGFSSDNWYRNHNLQHHMYTNTPWDNHHEGTAPFLITDPTVERNVLQRCVMPCIHPIVLSFGLYGNYLAHLGEMFRGNEVVTPWKLLLPLQMLVMAYKWGPVKGLLLLYLSHAVLAVYYFTMALMNHNAQHCHDVSKRNASRDWGEAQLRVSADWAVDTPFWAAGIYLWLNYHTVHHMFPKVDFSHHRAIQGILVETCREFGVEYFTGSPVQIYLEMVRSFASPSSLMQEIMVYGGGL